MAEAEDYSIMEPADAIARLGFRKWYERQLIEGHLWLVTCVLCMLLVATLVEMAEFRGPALAVLARAATVFAAGCVAAIAWKRYRNVMEAAERLAEHSTCPGCGTYARFRLVSGAMQVRCRRCGREWRLDGGG